MPNTSSAKKALRQNITRKKRNFDKKEAYKDALKSYKKLIVTKKKEEAKTALSTLYQALDKAAKVNVISRNKASRLKSRLTRFGKESKE